MLTDLHTVKVAGFDCPSCHERLFMENSGPTICPRCGWRGEAYIMRALREKVESANDAAMNQAVCAFHPTKQAMAVCAGSGDYICSLCAVEMDGEVYSAGYLSRGGKKKLTKTFSRRLNRPDREMTVYLLLTLIFFFLAPVMIPLAIHRYFRALKLRKTDELFARMFSNLEAFVWGIILAVMTVLYTLGAIALIM